MRKTALFCALMMTLALLPGCGGEKESRQEPALALRTQFLALKSCQAAASVTADYGDRTYTYEAVFSGDGLSGSMAVSAPENIAGVVVTWGEGETALEIAGARLDTGPLSADGLSPADCFPLILESCCRGAMVSSCEETLDGAESLRVTFQNPDLPADADSQVDVWADPDTYALRRAEVSKDGRTVIALDFTEFTFIMESSDPLSEHTQG